MGARFRAHASNLACISCGSSWAIEPRPGSWSGRPDRESGSPAITVLEPPPGERLGRGRDELKPQERAKRRLRDLPRIDPANTLCHAFLPAQHPAELGCGAIDPRLDVGDQSRPGPDIHSGV